MLEAPPFSAFQAAPSGIGPADGADGADRRSQDCLAGAAARWADAILAARVIVAGCGRLGGIRVRAGAGPVRDRWLSMLQTMANAAFGDRLPMLRVPATAAAGRLTGGIDVAATLAAGRTVHDGGLLARAHGGMIVLPMAERLPLQSAAIIGQALDSGTITGQGGRMAQARFSVIALDEAACDEEDLPHALASRLTLDLRLDGIPVGVAGADHDLARHLGQTLPDAAALAIPHADDRTLEAIAALSLALPEKPVRRSSDILRVARILAAFDAEAVVSPQHVADALRLVAGPLALAEQGADNEDHSTEPEPSDAVDLPPDHQQSAPDRPGETDPRNNSLPDDLSAEDMAVAAAAASRAVLDALAQSNRSRAARGARTGKAGAQQNGARRGRPAGLVSRPPFPGARPDVVATLRAAIPWQRLRNPDFSVGADGRIPPLRILASDFRYQRYRHRTESIAIFAVDASGSTAFDRLAEAKGAIELLLGDCYVRRDHVAMVAFRGRAAETLLEPTRSLVRAKRSLTALPGGGPTPLASAIRSALDIAGAAKRRGQSPLVVYLTDGSGNIALDGSADRPKARSEAEALGRLGAAMGVRSVFIDIARRPREAAHALADAMQADYCPLPAVSAQAVSAIVGARLERSGS